MLSYSLIIFPFGSIIVWFMSEKLTTVKPIFFNTRDGKFESTNRPLNRINELLGKNPIKELDRLQSEGRSFTVLDAPCGSLGVGALEIAKRYPLARVRGVDLNLADRVSTPNIELNRGDFFQLPPSGDVDLAIVYGFLAYFEATNFNRLLEGIEIVCRSLKPGGVALLDAAWQVHEEARAKKLRKFGITEGFKFEMARNGITWRDKLALAIFEAKWPDLYFIKATREESNV